MSAPIRSESNLNSAQVLTQVCREQQLIIEQQDGLIQELVEANNELRETVNAQRDEIQSQQIDIECHVQKIDEGLKTIAEYQGLAVMAQDMAARANSRLSELQIHITRILTAKDKATGKDLLMVTYVSDIPKVLSSMRENHQIVKINEFYVKLTKKLALDLPNPLPGKVRGEDDSFKKLVSEGESERKTLREVTEYLKELRGLTQGRALAERLQVLVYDYIFPTKLCVGQLKNLALRKATPHQIQKEVESMFSIVFESVSVAKEEHLFESAHQKMQAWQIVLSRGVLPKIRGGSAAFIQALQGMPKSAVELCDTLKIKGIFAPDEEALDRIEKGKGESTKAAKVYQDITLYISCDGNLLDEVMINNSQIVYACEKGGDILSWLLGYLQSSFLNGSTSHGLVEGAAGGTVLRLASNSSVKDLYNGLSNSLNQNSRSITQNEETLVSQQPVLPNMPIANPRPSADVIPKFNEPPARRRFSSSNLPNSLNQSSRSTTQTESTFIPQQFLPNMPIAYFRPSADIIPKFNEPPARRRFGYSNLKPPARRRFTLESILNQNNRSTRKDKSTSFLPLVLQSNKPTASSQPLVAFTPRFLRSVLSTEMQLKHHDFSSEGWYEKIPLRIRLRVCRNIDILRSSYPVERKVWARFEQIEKDPIKNPNGFNTIQLILQEKRRLQNECSTLPSSINQNLRQQAENFIKQVYSVNSPSQEVRQLVASAPLDEEFIKLFEEQVIAETKCTLSPELSKWVKEHYTDDINRFARVLERYIDSK